MVPDTNTLQIKSILKTLSNIFENLNIIALEKRRNILEQNWDELYHNSCQQQRINQFFDDSMKKVNDYINFKNDVSDNPETRDLRRNIKEKLMNYKELENINIKLLNDNLFISKQKVEKFLNKKPDRDTYTKELKKVSNLWGNSPIVLDKLI